MTEKSCGKCQHLQSDGMFGMWCELNNSNYPYNTDDCPYYQRSLLSLLNEKCKTLKEENVQLLQDLETERKRYNKLHSRYDKSKPKELKILVETENTVLLNKKDFEWYVRHHEDCKKRNKRRREKNRKYRKEIKKLLKENSKLKDFISENLSSEIDERKILKGFIEEYL